MPNEYLSLEEKLSSKMSRKLGEKYGLTELEEAKVNYGLAILFINLFKFMLIYVSAFFLHSILAVITTHLSFIAVRRYAKGYHASRSMACTLYSMDYWWRYLFWLIITIWNLHGTNISSEQLFLVWF